MATRQDITGLIVAMDEEVIPGLARFAIRHGWSVIQNREVGQAARLVLRRRSQVIIVQVSLRLDDTVTLIHLLRRGGRSVPVVAVASVHDEQVERAIRAAGAQCYLPGSNDVDVIEQALADVLPTDVMTQEQRVEHVSDEMNDSDVTVGREYPRLLRGKAS